MEEQTPIEQKLKSIISVELMDLSIMDEVVEHKTDEIYKGVMVIINTKVLEALERDLKDLSDCYKAHAKENPRKEVCQVLHTLIMEKQEQIAQTKQK